MPANTDTLTSANDGFTGSNGDIVSIISKYKLTSIGNATAYKMQLADLNGMKNLTTCKGAYLIGDIKHVNVATQMLEIQFVGRYHSGSLTEVATKFPNLTTLYFSSSNLTGKLSDLGTLIALTYLAFGDFTRETSTIEAFVTAQRTARVAKGLPAENSIGIRMEGLNSSDVTFNEVKVSSNDATLSWTSDTITFDGITINA
jgi:hypothetical protein